MSSIAENVIKFPEEIDLNPDHYAKTCPECGGIHYLITLANRIICDNCSTQVEFSANEV